MCFREGIVKFIAKTWRVIDIVFVKNESRLDPGRPRLTSTYASKQRAIIHPTQYFASSSWNESIARQTRDGEHSDDGDSERADTGGQN